MAQEIPSGELDLRAREAETREFFLTDTLSKVPYYEGEELVVHEFLWPYEAEGEEISPWEARPILTVLSRRAGRDVLLQRLEEIKKRKEEEEEKARNQLKDVTGLSEEEQADLWKKVSWLESSRKGTERRIDNRYQDPEEATEWSRILRETEAAIYLRNRYEQSVGFQYNKDAFIEILKSERRATIYPRQLAYLLESPGSGPVMEEAARLLFDVHLLGGFSDPEHPDKLVTKVSELKADDGMLSAATELRESARSRRKKLEEKRRKGRRLKERERVELEELKDLEKMKVERLDEKKGILHQIPLSALRVLQHNDNIKERLMILEAAIKDYVGWQYPKLGNFVLKRGFLHAISLVGFDPLLTSWLSVPRKPVAKKGELERWEIVSKEPTMGFGSFKEGKRNDLRKLVYTRAYNLDQRERGRPAGPPALTPVLPDLSLPYFVDPGTAAVYMDEETLEVHPARREKGDVSIFIAWWGGNRKRAKEKKDAVPLANVLRLVPDGAFSYGDYRTGRQDKVLQWMLSNVAGQGEKEDNIRDLYLADRLRGVGKAVQIAFRGRMDEGRRAVVNTIVSRFLAWNEKPQSEMSEVVSEGYQKLGDPKTVKLYIWRACRKSGLLKKADRKLAEQGMKKKRLFTHEEFPKT